MRRGFDTAAAAVGSRLEPDQAVVAEELARLGTDLVRHRSRAGGRRPGRPVRGVYLHGRVGRGKTWLAETLLQQLPAEGVLRLHAYDAARRLHAEVARTIETPGALDRAVAHLLEGVDLLYLDEFHAHDPGDAMLLARLVRALPARRATLLATSNYPPHGLLPDPLHHHLVLPLIAALEQGCDVVELRGDRDHRREGRGGARPGWSSGAWHLGRRAPRETAAPTVVLVAGRPLPVLDVGPQRVTVTFAALCEGRTAVSDVLELADRFTTVELVDVPVLTGTSPDARRRFAGLVDVLCDRDTRLVVHADGPLEEVVTTEDVEHERTRSRLRLLGTAAQLPAEAGSLLDRPTVGYPEVSDAET